MFPSRPVGVLALILTTSACVDSTGPAFPLIEETSFAPSLGIDLSAMTRIGGGMYVQDLELGAGETVTAGPRQRVEIAYDLYLADGSFVERVDPLRYKPGCRQVLSGLEAGVRGMREGGRRRLVVPGRMGYALDPPAELAIPIGAILVIEVEVVWARLLTPPEC